MTSAADDAIEGSRRVQGKGSVVSHFIKLDVVCKSAIALGIFLRFLWVQKRELWYDEVLSVLLSASQKNAYQLPQNVPVELAKVSQLLFIPQDTSFLDATKDVIKGTLGDPHPPLFYLAEHVWMRWFGSGEGALRSLMLLVSVAALGAAYAASKQLLGRRGALVFTALLSLNPFFLSHSLNLRMYAPLVLWALVSAGCLFGIINSKSHPSASSDIPDAQRTRAWLLRAGLATSLTAGLLTQYLFAYWLFAISALALHLDRKRWLQHGLNIGAGVVLFLPWAFWGVRQQIHNRRDVLTQISSMGSSVQSAMQHGKDLAQTVANHLLLGHLTTSLMPIGESIKPTAVAVGCGVVGFLAFCTISLYRHHHKRVLAIALLMGALPLGVALTIDVLADKYTLGFGWGRSTIVALPGCLLLVAAWLDLCTGRWRALAIASVLTIYLSVNLADFGVGGVGGRDRQMFHTVRDSLSAQPALIALDTQAWGHVLRLAYYLEGELDVELLAANPADMSATLSAALNRKDYAQVLWLHSEFPLWAKPETEQAAQTFAAQTETVLRTQFLNQASAIAPEPQQLSGTMNLDRFVLHNYQKEPA